MKRHLIALICLLSLCLSGCSWMDGSYLSITPHLEQNMGVQTKDRTASNYLQLRNVLEEMVDAGVENAVINVADYREDLVEVGMAGNTHDEALRAAELLAEGILSLAHGANLSV